MTVFEVLDVVRRKPRFYLQEESLKVLWVFLAGYEIGIQSCGQKRSLLGELRPFSIWVAKELGFSSYAKGWSNMIRERADSDQAAFRYFFELLDRFKRETGET